MSHSFFGVSVKVASPFPAAISASLYATLPVSTTWQYCLNGSHSPRLSSERLASTCASATCSVVLTRAGAPSTVVPAPRAAE